MFLTKDIALLAFWNKIFVPFRRTGWTAPSRQEDLAPPCDIQHGWAGFTWAGCTLKQLSCNLVATFEVLATSKMDFLRYLFSEWSEFYA